MMGIRWQSSGCSAHVHILTMVSNIIQILHMYCVGFMFSLSVSRFTVLCNQVNIVLYCILYISMCVPEFQWRLLLILGIFMEFDSTQHIIFILNTIKFLWKSLRQYSFIFILYYKYNYGSFIAVCRVERGVSQEMYWPIRGRELKRRC